jgi:hypothetical protein
MALFHRTISLIRLGETPISVANFVWLNPKGTRNSSCKIIPGCIGGIFFSSHN